MRELKDKILEEYKKGNIVIATPEGLQGTKLSEFIKQPADGLLYDLNRNEAVVLTFIDDSKWVNDYAVCQVIRALKHKINELENVSERNLKLTDLLIKLKAESMCSIVGEEWINQHLSDVY